METWLDPLFTFTVSLTRTAHQLAAQWTVSAGYNLESAGCVYMFSVSRRRTCMSAQCVLLDRVRHVPPPERESYIHRISTDRRRDTADAPARDMCF